MAETGNKITTMISIQRVQTATRGRLLNTDHWLDKLVPALESLNQENGRSLL
jgi:hypothetical protein